MFRKFKFTSDELFKIANQDVTVGDNKVKQLREALRDAAMTIEELKQKAELDRKFEVISMDTRFGIMQDRIDRLISTLNKVSEYIDPANPTTMRLAADIDKVLRDEEVFGRFESAYEEIRPGVIVEKNPCAEIKLGTITTCTGAVDPVTRSCVPEDIRPVAGKDDCYECLNCGDQRYDRLWEDR